MNRIIALALLISLSGTAHAQAADPVAEAASKIATEVKTSTAAYQNLTELTAIGPRLSGTPAAEKAVEWAVAKLSSYGFDRVWTQAVEVPHWERGAERAVALRKGVEMPLAIGALGGSVGTSSGPVEAEVVEAYGLDALKTLGYSVRGQIVFFNKPMDPARADAFEAYGEAVGQRAHGASHAAALGAVAVLVRSMTTLTDDPLPHTGGLRYSTDTAKIPAAALSTRDADWLSRLISDEPGLRVRMELGAQSLPPVVSHNVIAELKGRDKPDEYVVIGGHLDSWDLGPGAHDDGVGVVESIEALRALKALGLRPKRTIRVVLFMSEEEGGIGGAEYAKQAKLNREHHVAALESDRGGFAPLGFSASSATLRMVGAWKPYLALSGAGAFFPGGTGTDTSFLEEQGVPSFELIPESLHYFDYHHSARDRLEAVDPKELSAGAAAVAVFAYVAAELGPGPESRIPLPIPPH
jgi:hypothetical protein